MSLAIFEAFEYEFLNEQDFRSIQSKKNPEFYFTYVRGQSNGGEF